jgi:hypothetical protein
MSPAKLVNKYASKYCDICDGSGIDPEDGLDCVCMTYQYESIAPFAAWSTTWTLYRAPLRGLRAICRAAAWLLKKLRFWRWFRRR